MTWAYLLAAALGLASGLLLKAYAMAVASLAILVLGTVGAILSGWSAGWALLAAFGAIFVFQSGYFLSLTALCRARGDSLDQDEVEQAARFDEPLVQTRLPGRSI